MFEGTFVIPVCDVVKELCAVVCDGCVLISVMDSLTEVAVYSASSWNLTGYHR